MIRLSDPRSAALGLFVGCVATVAAAVAAEVRVYEVPAGAHPHDVAPAPDGAVWYTAQHHGALGILDPATGAVREVALGSGSRPHGVIQGPAGNAWITDGGQNAIVRYDPLADAVTVWRLPADAGYANLNTAAFDAGGVLWFTGQSGIYGRLDPATGAIEVFPAPCGRGPYGIAATPDGTGVLRFARRQLCRPHRRPQRRRERDRAADAPSGRAPRMGGQLGQRLGRRVERGPAQPLHARLGRLAQLEAPG